MPSISHANTSGEYAIKNNTTGGSITFTNKNSSGLVGTVTIDKDMNVSGIKELKCSTIKLNNTTVDLSPYNTVVTNSQMIRYGIDPIQTNITNSSNNGFFMVPNAGNLSYNNLSKAGDNLIVSSNNALGLTVWSSKPACGIRITQDNTELNKPKIMDSLTFSDTTIQTTAMTETIVNNLINAAISKITIPVGTISAYAGTVDPGNGYLICDGRQLNITDFQNLYNVIGQSFLQVATVVAGKFNIPNLKGAFLKGIGVNSTWSYNTDITSIGSTQQANVGTHRHQYIRNTNGTNNLVGGVGYYMTTTTEYAYTTTAWKMNSTTLTDDENRPNCVGVNYIIKY